MRRLDPQVDLARALATEVFGTPRPQPVSMSPALVGPSSDTIGYLGGCWCGQPHGHDWPLKSDGAPHPRYPV